MTRVDFYRLEAGDTLQAACLVTGKAYQAGYRVRVYTRDESSLADLDARLWTFRQNAFVPHAPRDRVDSEIPEPVVLATDCLTPEGTEVLVCVAPPPPECLDHYERVAEFVPPDPENRQAARQRYARYRAAGYDLYAHDIRAN
ncbi:DNA polymerase III subunit chi [Thiohalorhabdus sp.]|uniref:DNA polymerase III subunit chi n=1 Tax=Thiohalorhabdus sp. TaxID=3094134 RepID=UPI002FC36A37